MTRAGLDGPFVVPVASLRRHAGTRRALSVAAPIEDLAVSYSAVVAGTDVVFEGALESFGGGVMVGGEVGFAWEGVCRRCLERASGTGTSEVTELCGDDPDLETEYPIDGDMLDLEPVVRDACILSLPLAPLCRPDCAGLCPGCGVNLNMEPCICTETLDPRWAGLASLAAMAPRLVTDQGSDDGRTEEEDLEVEEP